MDGRPTVLMIGPLPPPTGGQAVLVSNLMHSSLTARFRFVVMNVAHESPGLVVRSALTAAFACRLFLLLVCRPAIKLLHVHTSAGTAFFEKSLFVALGKCFGKKVILHIHGGRFRNFWNEAGSHRKRFISRLLGLNDAIVVLGNSWSAFYENEVKCRCPIVVVPNAVAVKHIEFQARSANEVTLLYVGQLRREKGLLDLAAALVRVSTSSSRKLRLEIMGQGDTRESERLVRAAYVESGLTNVDFLGSLAGDEKWRHFSSADVFVLPSHNEDMPISILEAMAIGLPVIAADVGAVSEMVDDAVTGYLIKPHNVPELADRIQALAENPQLRAAMGAAGSRKSRELFSFERYEKRIERLYLALLER
jgi:glycosyltransferase involved in cell wall biosynthesis